jgi:FAD:protein FMN transferase
LDYYHYAFSVMGCPASYQFYAPSPQKAEEVKTSVFDLLAHYDQYYTNYSSKSFTSEINRQTGSSKGIVVDDETAILLDYAQSCYELSNGLFDITSGPLHRIWVFDAHEPSLPTEGQIAEVLGHVGWDKLIWKKPHLVLPIPRMNIDFGGVVKEYAVDVGVNLSRQLGIHHGVLELGGDIGIIGPHLDGTPWRVGIQASHDPTKDIAVINMAEGAIATSGSYARSMVIDGVRYCHILNPKTGYPVQGVTSVSVQADFCLVAGSLTTISFLKGHEGLSWIQDQNVPYIFVDDSLKAHSTM